jgi:hypothetical protein
MNWQHTYAARVRDHQQALLDEAATRRLARGATTVTPRYREWLARQLVLLASRLAPSLYGPVRRVVVTEGSAPLPAFYPPVASRLHR